jgi:hypothetical protein
MADKPIVQYHPTDYPTVVGDRAYVVPLDHPRKGLNGQYVTTSQVLSYDSVTGEIETMFTRYVLAESAL